MDKQESMERLESLLHKIEVFETMSAKLQKAEDELDDLKNNYPTKLSAFDNEHKEAFVAVKIGKRPSRPDGAVKLLVPIYLGMKLQYQRELGMYNKMRPLAEAAYRETFAEQRKALEEQDEIEQQQAIGEKEATMPAIRDAFTQAKASLESDDLLSEKLKSKEVIEEMMGYFNDHRVDTLKEAVNLWYDERRKDEEEAKAEAHRKEMKALEEERLRAAKAAEEYASMHYDETSYEAGFPWPFDKEYKEPAEDLEDDPEEQEEQEER